MTAPDDFVAAPEDASYRPRLDRSIGRLFAELTEDLRRLFRLEVELFRRELAEKLGRLSRGLIAVAVGGLLALARGWCFSPRRCWGFRPSCTHGSRR